MVDVSIIVPTFNRLWCLPEAIESCRNSACSTEIIVIDDGSTDGTSEWLKAQPDVVSFRQENLGKDWAVNFGMRHARGEYVRFLDSDDALTPGAIDVQLAAAKQSQADVVTAGHIFCDEHLQEICTQAWVYCDDFIAQQLGECDSSHYSAYLFRKAFIDPIPHRQEYGVRDDRKFIIEVALEEPRVVSVSQPCLRHRHHQNARLQFQTGLNATVTNWQHLQIYKSAARTLAARNALTARRKRAIAKALWPLAHWISYTHLDDGTDVARWVRELDPDFQPPEPGLLGLLYRRFGFRATERVLHMRRSLLKPFRR